MRKALLLLSFSTGLFLVHLPRPAYAHFPQTDKNITAVLHVEPDDYPAAGQPEAIYFIFSDITNRFKLSKCICSLSITQGKKEFFYGRLDPPQSRGSTVYDTQGIPFSFPSPEIIVLN